MGDPADPDSVSEGLGFESAKEKVFTQTAVVFLLLPPESFQHVSSSSQLYVIELSVASARVSRLPCSACKRA